MNIEPVRVTASEVEQEVRSFPAGSTGGLSGLRPQHMKDNLTKKTSGDEAQKLLLTRIEIVNLLSTGNVTSDITPISAVANLSAFCEKDGAIRTNSVGYTLRSLPGKFVAKRLFPQKNPCTIQPGFRRSSRC